VDAVTGSITRRLTIPGVEHPATPAATTRHASLRNTPRGSIALLQQLVLRLLNDVISVLLVR
jgi:hypothetical protein